jgi:serine protein kinase
MTASGPDAASPMEHIGHDVRATFEAQQRILPFDRYLDLFREAPYRMARSAIQYLRDAIDHFGNREVGSVGGPRRRYQIFDCAFRDGRGRVHGQEAIQESLVRVIRASAGLGIADRMILLHGPNGSAKTSLVEALMFGLEAYSTRPEGALYRFNWIFPKQAAAGAGLGFGGGGEDELPDSFAELPPESVVARLGCELKDHPLFLVPPRLRKPLLEDALESSPEDRDQSFRYLLEGDLSPKSKQIYEALLASYLGDWRAVMRHVQVERFYVSKRFRAAAVSIEPQGNVDAEVRAITADLSAGNLPPALHNVQLLELSGDLVDANGGVIEYSDFLKRPLEMSKYLLTTTERGTISLPSTLAYLNVVIFGTTNDVQLDGFKQTPEFPSFKARTELVTVPFILEISKEARIYEDHVRVTGRKEHIAPHAIETAARFAVLTRLLKPDPSHFEEPLRAIVDSLEPYEKARLYDGGQAPERLGAADRKTLRAAIPDLSDEYREGGLYEGRFGASPRLMRGILLDAADAPGSRCLTPMAVLDELRELLRDRSLHEFLQIEAREGFHDAERFVHEVESVLVEDVLTELQDAMELIREEEYDRRFERYFQHVLAFNKGEMVRNPSTGNLEKPDESVMASVEKLLTILESVEEFRQNLVAKIGAYAVDHPGEGVSFRGLFPDVLRALKDEFRQQRREQIRTIQGHLLLHDTDGFAGVPEEERDLVESTIRNMIERHGYCESCLKDVVSFVLKRV